MRHQPGITRRVTTLIAAAALATLGLMAVGVTSAYATGSVEANCMQNVTPVAVDNGDGTASLSWHDDCSNVINNGQSNSYYNIEVSTDGGITWTLLDGPIYTDRHTGSPGQDGAVGPYAIDPCLSYNFRVVAVVETGHGNHVVTSISKKSNTLAATGTDCGGGGGQGDCTQLTGALTLGYYSNKNGQATITQSDLDALSALNLRTATGGNFDPANKTALKNWLLNGTATNMSYMLSVQLATLELNILHNLVDPDLTVCEFGGESIGDIVTDANNYLGTHPTVYGGDPDRPLGASLETIIDEINNNKVSVI